MSEQDKVTAPASADFSHRIVTFGEALPLAFRNFKEVEGRSSRGAFWYFFLWSLLLAVVAGFADAAIFGVEETDPQVISLILNLVLLVPSIAVSVRRLHDIGRSGWWYLLVFTIIGSLPLLYWFAQPGQRQANAYGPDAEAGR